jgi:16S rRNA (cytosine1402-N4)-methyltransferase
MTAPRPPEQPWASAYHAPVLVAEVLTFLADARRVLDCTLGGGGHTLALLEHGAHVVGVDRDPDALAAAADRLAPYAESGRFRALLGNYADLGPDSEIGDSRFDGILLDLGISSHQIDDLERGFSFREGTRLDMRMGHDSTLDAAALLNTAEEGELARIFRDYADEPRAGRLAREVVRRRANRPFETSDDLVGAIRGALGPRTGPGDFARLFQGLRIAVNDELSGLSLALPALRDRLAPGGVLAVIAYHSGEDRRVKHALREWSADCVCPPKQLICTCRGRALGELVTRKAVVSSDDEVARNPRARSARLRAWRSAR